MTCMGYTALLFCPDEKTARTVTQVLTELEFAVEACIEPFAAVKKLMGQHFDAVVVDCDNEQNATLLFKSARNSTSNQASLAVAVVEGQAGVAKAFRIGANLVLTKPINIEQAKGTLRVARGLLRKGDPGKAVPSAPVATTPAVPAKPAAPKPAAEPKAAARAAVPVFTPQPPSVAVAKPTPGWPAAVASSQASSEEDDLLEIEALEPESAPAATVAPIASAATPTPATFTSGAASAPAPAREIQPAPSPEKPAETAPAVEIESKPEVSASDSLAVVGSTPSFTFGGAAIEPQSKGSSKKIVIGVAAALIVGAGFYFGWTSWHTTSTQPATIHSAVPAPAPVQQASKPSSALASATPQPDSNSALPSPQPANGPSTAASPSDAVASPAETVATAAAHSSSATPSSAKPTPAEKPDSAPPLVVKGGQSPVQAPKPAADDAAAPSLAGMAAPGTSAPPADLVSSSASLKPRLQTLSISQGVSTGLLMKKIPPSYPASALRLRIEGTVELMATISKTGEISQVKVLSGDKQLTNAAVDAVKQWKYKPYLLNGEPVEIQTQVTVNFKLPPQ